MKRRQPQWKGLIPTMNLPGHLLQQRRKHLLDVGKLLRGQLCHQVMKLKHHVQEVSNKSMRKRMMERSPRKLDPLDVLLLPEGVSDLLYLRGIDLIGIVIILDARKKAPIVDNSDSE